MAQLLQHFAGRSEFSRQPGGSPPIEIRIAAGTYRPDQGQDKSATFQLLNGVTLSGGYAGLDNANPNERIFDVHETVLSGDLNSDDSHTPVPFTNTSDNAYHVVTGSGNDSTAILDGVTVDGGNTGDQTGFASGGGGLRMISTNGATEESSPTIKNCNFRWNQAVNGGAVYVIDLRPGQFSTPLLVNCTFTRNLAFGLDPNPDDLGFGGGVYCSDHGNATITNCTFVSNQATSPTAGGGGLTADNSTVTVTNSIFYFNLAAAPLDTLDKQVYAFPSATINITYSCIQGCSSTCFGSSTNIGDDPTFRGAPDDLRLLPGSPCNDSGDNSAVAGMTTDLDGAPRFVDDPLATDTGAGTAPFVDMGAFEWSNPAIFYAKSWLDHGPPANKPLALDLLVSNVEPRAEGVLSLEFTLSKPISADSVSASVSCVNQTYSGTITPGSTEKMVTVEFDPKLADIDACQIDLTGEVIDSFCVRSLRGDVDRNGSVTTGDASQLRFFFNQPASHDLVTVQWDYDQSGVVTTGDFSQIRFFFNNIAPACSSGASVVSRN